MADYNSDVLMCALDYFDGLAGAVPSPGGHGRLPSNLVIPGKFKFNKNGFGSKTEEQDDAVEMGTADVAASFCLWDTDAETASSKARDLIALILDSSGIQHTGVAQDGAEIELTIVRVIFEGISGPDFLNDLNAWKLSVSGLFEIDYDVRAPHGEGVIERVDVTLPDNITENFDVT